MHLPQLARSLAYTMNAIYNYESCFSTGDIGYRFPFE